MTSAPNPTTIGGRTNVRVAVIGDAGTGKSSLIVAVATESFPENVPRVVPPTRLPADYYPDRVPIAIIDTSSNPEHKNKTFAECQNADAIVLTYACDRLSTLDRLSAFWLPELRRLDIKVPVVVVGCKLDLRDEQQVSLEQVMSPIMQQFQEIESCIECSALMQIQVPEVFYYAQEAVHQPTAPLFDQETVIEASECCICLCACNDGGELRELPCSHQFHCDCIDKWLYINATCPLCKYNIVKSDNNGTQEQV